jgi:hypothetical protein
MFKGLTLGYKLRPRYLRGLPLLLFFGQVDPAFRLLDLLVMWPISEKGTDYYVFWMQALI